MGRDLIMAVCQIPGVTGEKFDQEAKELVAVLNEDSLCNSIDDLWSIEVVEETLWQAHDVTPDEEPPDEQRMAWLREYVLGEIISAEKYLREGSRMVADIKLNGFNYWMSGDGSWGDEPEGGFKEICVLATFNADMIGLTGWPYDCGNCGAGFEWESIRRTHDGTKFCPDCGSSEVIRAGCSSDFPWELPRRHHLGDEPCPDCDGVEPE